MKKLLFLLFPLIVQSQISGVNKYNYYRYIDMFLDDKYGDNRNKKVTITTDTLKIKDYWISDAYLVKEYYEFDGERRIISEKKFDNTRAWVSSYFETKYYDYTPRGGRFIMEHNKYRALANYRRETNYEQNNGEYVKKTISIERSIPDGIWIQRSLHTDLLTGKWQREEKLLPFLMRKQIAIANGKPSPSKVDNASPILIFKTIYIADHFIDQLVSIEDRKGVTRMRNIPDFGNNRYGDWNEINEKDLKAMVKVFIDDLINSSYQIWNGEFGKYNLKFWLFLEDVWRENETEYMNHLKGQTHIDAVFEPLKNDVVGVSLGIFNNKKITLRIDPTKWENATLLERWYTIYHELGHDILNLRHGEGGNMMFNFSINSDYKWEDFFEERDYMFKYFYENFDYEKFKSQPQKETNKISRQEAVIRLKEAKEMLDAGILSKEEYDFLSKKLKPIILNN